MIELRRDGYEYTPPAYVNPGEVAAVSVRAKHSMDDRNTTVVTLRSGVQIDTATSPEEVRRACEQDQR